MLLIFPLMIPLLLAGCRRDTPTSVKAAVVTPPAPLTLKETYDFLRSAYARRAFLAMRPFIDVDGCDQVIDLLIAVDELLAANAAAQKAVQAACPEFPLERTDLGQRLANNLDLFSRDMMYVDMEEREREGVVRVQIVGNVNRTELKFARQRERWVYQPGQGTAALVPIIRDIAGALHRMGMVLGNQRKTPEDINNEYLWQIGPRLKRISQLAATASRPA